MRTALSSSCQGGLDLDQIINAKEWECEPG